VEIRVLAGGEGDGGGDSAAQGGLDVITIACCFPSAELRFLGVTCELASDQGVAVCLVGLSEVDICCLLDSRGDGMRKRRDVGFGIGEVAMLFSAAVGLEVIVEAAWGFVARTNLLSAPAVTPVFDRALDFFGAF
jgi:hypothetical protein